MDWNDLRFFLALARHGSVRAAGQDLGVSHSTVARRVEALEAQLGTRLFDRHRDGYLLTTAGERMVPLAERVEDEVCALERGLAGEDERLAGTVSLTCSDEYIASMLLAELRPLCAEHPDIVLSVNTESRSLNLAKGEADLAIRVLGPHSSPPEYVVARKLAPLFVASYVAREHAARLDPRKGDTRWLAFGEDPTLEALVASSSYPDLPRWGALQSLRLMVHAALEGYGLCMLPTYVGEAEPGLRRVDPPDIRHMADIWLLYHPDLRTTARVQAVRSVILEGFARHVARFDPRSSGGPPGPAIAP